MTDRSIIIDHQRYASISEAARKLDVSRQQIYRWLERGKAGPVGRKPGPERRKLTDAERAMIEQGRA